MKHIKEAGVRIEWITSPGRHLAYEFPNMSCLQSLKARRHSDHAADQKPPSMDQPSLYLFTLYQPIPVMHKCQLVLVEEKSASSNPQVGERGPDRCSYQWELKGVPGEHHPLI
jgi:hypothetical protein